jgi:alginate O-acetyltransferase complex protein AlgI
MLFNSIDFAVFLPVVFALYWFCTQRSLPLQNALLLVASYVFYGWWDWRFLGLIVFSTAVDYGVGVLMWQRPNPGYRKLLLGVSVLVNLGLLGFFKYWDFFLTSFRDAFTLFGGSLEVDLLGIILPVGISFYTFQTLSYSIDVYKGKMQPERDFIAFAAYVSFFPQLVAGPIERAANLLPQFSRPRQFDRTKAVDGMRQILWGLFKKVVIADSCAPHVDAIFQSSDTLGGATLLLGAVLFSFQIYGDFSGYSDIAIGVARLFGFSLMRNFAFPYFSRDIAEFWRRWHISLSTWFRDYLYIPLGGSRGGVLFKLRNTLVIFLVSGFWHGANWTFVAWGLLHAVFFVPLLLANKNRRNLGPVADQRSFPNFGEAFQMVYTYALVTVAWVFFRAEDIGHAASYIHNMLTGLTYQWGYMQALGMLSNKIGFHVPALILCMLAVEWASRDVEHGLCGFTLNSNSYLTRFFYLAIAFSIFLFHGEQQEFIYFQF